MGILASDSDSLPGTPLYEAHKLESELVTRAVYFAQTSASASESAGSVPVTVTISPAPTASVTVPFSVSGTALKGKDYALAQSSVVFSAGETSRTIPVTLVDTGLISATNKTLVIKLGTAAPATQAYVPTTADTFTLSINEDDQKPVIATTQTFTAGTIGTAYNYQFLMTGGTSLKFSASGLPPGLTINATTGVISGRPTTPGEYDQVWITVTSPAGKAVSTGYLITVADFAPLAHGNFVGYVDRSVTATNGLGARIDLSVTSAATFTGKLTVGSVAYPLAGLLDTSSSDPTGTVTFKVGGVSNTLNFTIDATTGALTGSIDVTPVVTNVPFVKVSDIQGWRAQTSTALTGLFNFFTTASGGPAGTTYGSASVLATGAATTTLHGADGTVFATSAPIGPDGEVLIYQTAYTVPGSIVGNLTIGSDLAHTVAGTLSWTRPLTAGGWAGDITLTASGGKYRPVSGSGIVMDLAAGTSNASLIFQGGGVAAATTSPNIGFGISAPASVTIAAADKLTITNSTGAFSGSFKFVTGATSVLVPFQGLIVPDPTNADPFNGTGEGYFLMPGTGSVVTRSGSVSLSGSE